MKYYLLVGSITANVVCMAQTGTIKGTIKTVDNQAAEYVEVALKGTNYGASADKKGNYQLKALPVGTYTVVVAMMGVKADEKVVSVNEGAVTTADLILVEDRAKLDEVVVTSNIGRYNETKTSPSLRLQTPLLELAQNVQVVSKEVLKDQQVISMSDGLVRNVSGLVRMEHWGDMYTNITARGSQIQAFRNGFNVVNSYWGPLTEDMSFVENIEFVKGPAGFMIANGDPSGLYNVVTKKPTGITKGEANVTVGSFGLYRGSIDLDGKLSKDGKLLYRLNAAAQNKGSFRANEYNDRYTVAPVISYQLDNKTKLTLEYNYQKANMSNVGSYYVFSPFGFATLPVASTQLSAGLPGATINDHSFYAILKHDFNKDWSLTAQATRFIYDQVGSSMWPSSVNSTTGKLIRSVSIWDAHSEMNMAQMFVNGKLKTGGINHRILGGLDITQKAYMADWGQSYNLDSVGAEFDPMNPNLGTPVMGYPEFDRTTSLEVRAQKASSIVDQKYTSIYLQDELGFFENKARLTLAGRYTDLSQSVYGAAADKAKRVTPRVGLSVSTDEQTAVYALYDQAFVPQTGMKTDGSKVRPITGNNMEVGAKREWMGGKWQSTVAVYRILKNNELIADPTQSPAAGLSIELGQKVAQGAELDIRGTIARGLNVVANYAYTDAKVLKVADGVTSVKEGDIIPGFSKHTANVWLTYKLQQGALKGLGVAAGCTWLGDRATYWEPSPNPDQTLDNYFKVDGGLFWEHSKMRITLNAFNLLNEYLYSGSYYSWLSAYNWQTEAPRNYRLSVSYRF